MTPCSLVLWRIQLIGAWRDFTHSSVQLPLACGMAVIFSLFIIAVLLQTLLGKTSITTVIIKEISRHFPVVNLRFISPKNVSHDHFPLSEFSIQCLSSSKNKVQYKSVVTDLTFVHFYHQHFTLRVTCQLTNHQRDAVNQQSTGKESVHWRPVHTSSEVTSLQRPTTAFPCRRHRI